MSDNQPQIRPTSTLIAQLVADHLWSEASFKDFVNVFSYHNSLPESAPERLLANLCRTNHTWARPARLALRKRIVIRNVEALRDIDSLLNPITSRSDESPDVDDEAEIASHPWVTELYIRDDIVRFPREEIDIAPRVIRLFEACPNVRKLYLKTVFVASNMIDFDSIVARLGKLVHLRMLWLRHVPGLDREPPPDLATLCAILPELYKLEKLFVTGWTLGRRDRSDADHKHARDWGESSPPKTLKTLSIQSFATYRGIYDPQALSWLLKPTSSYRPTAFSLSMQDVALFLPKSQFLTCMRALLPNIHSLHAWNYDERKNATLMSILELCCSLRRLCIIVSPKMDTARTILLLFDNSESSKISGIPRNLRELHIHFRGGFSFRPNMYKADNQLATQIRMLPDLKKVSITTPLVFIEFDLHPPLVNWDTFQATRVYCEAMGIEFAVEDTGTSSPPLPYYY